MNYLYTGYSSDLNVGNGKTVSAVGAVLHSWATNPDKIIFSNIKLFDVDYQQFTPQNIDEVLDTKNAVVLLDELHSIVHKNHRISEGCGKHVVKGLCYKLSEFFRQVRKRGIDTHSTSQTEADVQFQLWQLMNVKIKCEKYHDERGYLSKCIPRYPDQLECPPEHRHWIIQLINPAPLGYGKLLFDPELLYNKYDSFEVVKGWVSYD